MVRGRRGAGGLLLVALLALLVRQPGDVATAGPTDFAAVVVPHRASQQIAEFPVLDPSGRQIRTMRWRVTDAGSNCCEAYVAASSTGRLVGFGGSLPVFSDDRGATWQEVRTATPLLGGEGAIVGAPGGDVVGIGWDPYTGDHLQGFKYSAATGEWRYSEVLVHQPFYDRPWIAVVKGPFQHAGGTAPYASVVMTNYTSWLADVVYISYDGLTYVTPSAAQLDALGTAAESRSLAPRGDPDVDTMQSHTRSGLVTLPGSGLLDTVGAIGSPCVTKLLGTDSRWRCLTTDIDPLKPATVADSRGWLHDTEVVDGELLYRTSSDGGVTWSETTLRAPRGGVFDEFTEYDVKVHGGLRKAAVAAHVVTGDTHQDMVFVLDVATPRPVLKEIALLGNGDLSSLAGVSQDIRFDYATLAFLPDGSLATSFFDSSVPNPHVAIELR